MNGGAAGLRGTFVNVMANCIATPDEEETPELRHKRRDQERHFRHDPLATLPRGDRYAQQEQREQQQQRRRQEQQRLQQQPPPVAPKYPRREEEDVVAVMRHSRLAGPDHVCDPGTCPEMFAIRAAAEREAVDSAVAARRTPKQQQVGENGPCSNFRLADWGNCAN